MYKNKLSLFTIFLVILILLSSCGSKGANSPKTNENRLVYASESEFDGLNPILEETNLDALLFRGLMRFNEKNEPVTDIADSIEISDDGLTYTIKLKKGIKFHDGKELTADDVIFTIESILDDKNASFLKSDFTEVDSITKLNDHEFELTLKHLFTPILDKLTVPILPKHAFEGKDMRTTEFNSQPIGAGPYMFDNWEPWKQFDVESLSKFPWNKTID